MPTACTRRTSAGSSQRERLDHHAAAVHAAGGHRAAGAQRLQPPGKHVVVVGRGVTIGRSIGLLLTRRDVNATVTLTHTGTVDLSSHLRAG